MGKTLRSVPELRAAGLVSTADAAALQAVAARYAVAITPAMASVSFSHFERSAVSCRRPAEVRR